MRVLLCAFFLGHRAPRRVHSFLFLRNLVNRHPPCTLSPKNLQFFCLFTRFSGIASFFSSLGLFRGSFFLSVYSIPLPPFVRSGCWAHDGSSSCCLVVFRAGRVWCFICGCLTVRSFRSFCFFFAFANDFDGGFASSKFFCVCF